jgi:hypothetical protein
MADKEDKAWFYLTGQGDSAQHHGPFPVETMKGAQMAITTFHEPTH